VCWRTRSYLSLALVLTGAVAEAQSISDPQTGLAVTAPAGYIARSAPPRARYSAVIEVKRGADRDTGCKVAFQPNAQSLSMSQAQINELAGTPERRAVIESSLGSLYLVAAVEQVEHDGALGAVATAAFKPLPGLPARAGDMISVFYILETPTGRTTIVCVSEREVFAERRSEFDAVLRGVTLPR
jgi:hypothetical protein